MVPKAFASVLARKIFHTDLLGRPSVEQKALEHLAKDAAIAPYIEEEPSIRQWLWNSLKPTRQGCVQYISNLFPFTRWMARYNVHWMMNDAIAGLTVSLVVLPQGLAYAHHLAKLSPEHGLYTSFAGAASYWIFGTSKDIVIGTTAIASLLIGGVITTVEHRQPGAYTREDISKGVSLFSGVVLILFGLFRLGWLIELIPYVPISAFITSASFTILSTQLATALGITGINTEQAPYLVYIDLFKALPRTQLDAAIGLSSLALLSLLRIIFGKMEIRQPAKKKFWSAIGSLSLTFIMFLYTFIGWIVHRKLPPGEHKFRIVGYVQPGFRDAGVPHLSINLYKTIAPSLPPLIIILVIEHIAIAKSFGRASGYSIIPSQEILAQGVSNILAAFVGGWTVTGSFGASAVLSKSNVRTPLAGLFRAAILVLALYKLTVVFYYIPNAALGGLIIHAVMNLITPPSALYRYWKLSPFELIIWVVGVVVALFVDLTTSIYTTIALSFALLLVRMARSKGSFMGRVRSRRLVVRNSARHRTDSQCSATEVHEEAVERERYVFFSLNRKDNPNTRIEVMAPYPGIFIYRFNEAFNYINCAQHMDHLTTYVKSHTRSTRSDDGLLPRDRLWSEPLNSAQESPAASALPPLRSIILDCSTINHLDITSIQALIDARNSLDRYAAPAMVEWHFAGLHSRWSRRALAVAGFGFPVGEETGYPENWCPAYSVASSLAGATNEDNRTADPKRKVERRSDQIKSEAEENDINVKGRRVGEQEGSLDVDEGRIEEMKNALEPLNGVEWPFFHVDLLDAVDMAGRDAMKRDQHEISRMEVPKAK